MHLNLETTVPANMYYVKYAQPYTIMSLYYSKPLSK